MANYFLHVKTFSRGNGSSVTRAAAYRAGERIRDERSGAVHDHSDRTDVAHAEIMLPSDYVGRVDLSWARDRSILWNAVQHSGRQWNSRMAREVLVHVPQELTPTQRVHLVRGFSQELADRYRNAVDFAIHAPRPWADHRHHHAHILMTARELGSEGVGARTTLELSGTERHARGLGPSKDELLWMRERWAAVANEALKAAGLSIRLDHRSYQDQGLDREPQAVLTPAILYSERHSGKATPAGDDIRARHRERVEARLKGPAELKRVLDRQRREGRQRATEWNAQHKAEKKIPTGALTREELNQKRREYCKANREEINRKQRERRRANAEEVNRKQREYLRKRQAEKKAAHEPNVVADRAPFSATADTSVKNWLAFRGKQEATSKGESLQHWVAYREGQMETAPPKSPAQDRGRDSDTAASGTPDRETATRNSTQGRDHDHTL